MQCWFWWKLRILTSQQCRDHTALRTTQSRTMNLCYVTNRVRNSLNVTGHSLSLFVSETDVSGNKHVEVVVGEILNLKVHFSLVQIMVDESSLWTKNCFNAVHNKLWFSKLLGWHILLHLPFPLAHLHWGRDVTVYIVINKSWSPYFCELCKSSSLCMARSLTFFPQKNLTNLQFFVHL